MKRWMILSLLALSACPEDDSLTADSGGISDEMPDDLPAGECRDTEGCDAATSTGAESSTSSTGSGEPECVESEDCDGAGACAAPWNGDVRGPFECRFACIPTLDEASWCSDDASCCDAGAFCTLRGYCVLEDESGTGTGTG